MPDLQTDTLGEARAAADRRAIGAFTVFEFLWNLGCGMFALQIVSAYIVAMGGPLTVAGMIPALGGIIALVAQPLAMLLFSRIRDRRRATAALLQTMSACFLALGVSIFLLPPGFLHAAVVPITLTLCVVGLFFGSLNAPLYYSLAIDAVSPRQLGRLTGLRQVGNAAGNLAASLLVAWLLTTAAQPFNYGRALVLGGILGIFGCSSVLLMPEPYHPLAHGDDAQSPWSHLAETLHGLWSRRAFRMLMGGLWLSMVVSGAAGLGVAQLRRATGSDAVVGIVVVVSSIARLLSGPACGWLVTRCGMRSAAFISLGASAAGFAALVYLPALPAAVVWGVVLGLTLATMEMWSYMLPAHLFPAVNRVNLVALLVALTGPVMFVTPVILGRLLDAGVATTWVFLPVAGVAVLTMGYFWYAIPDAQ